MKPRKPGENLWNPLFEIRFIETIVFTDLVQFVKPYKTRRKLYPMFVWFPLILLLVLRGFMASRVGKY